jgi:hypothetical protein
VISNGFFDYGCFVICDCSQLIHEIKGKDFQDHMLDSHF